MTLLFHGIATAKIDFESISVMVGDQGNLTAYLPEMEKFAIMFQKDKWITFSMNEEEFLKSFNVIKE